MRLLVLLLVAACGDGAPPAVIDAPPADAPEPCDPLGECAWLVDYQRRIVDTLGGTVEIAPGVMLQHRASIEERDFARTFLEQEFAALQLPATRDTYSFDGRAGANLIARLEPTNPAATAAPAILVGAHFDGVAAGPGAADNATGVAIVLATARYLQSVPRDRAVIFALFDQEELGLIGSRAYATSLVDGGVTLKGAHIFDMLAWDGDGDRTVELWSPSPPLEALYRAHGPAHQTPISAVFFGASDHQAFLERSFPAVGVGEEFVGDDHTPHYHKLTDTVANVQFAHLDVVTRLAFSVLADDTTD